MLQEWIGTLNWLCLIICLTFLQTRHVHINSVGSSGCRKQSVCHCVLNSSLSLFNRCVHTYLWRARLCAKCFWTPGGLVSCLPPPHELILRNPEKVLIIIADLNNYLKLHLQEMALSSSESDGTFRGWPTVVGCAAHAYSPRSVFSYVKVMLVRSRNRSQLEKIREKVRQMLSQKEAADGVRKSKPRKFLNGLC